MCWQGTGPLRVILLGERLQLKLNSWPISCGSSLEHVGHMLSLPSWGHGVFEDLFLLELVLGSSPCEWTLEAVLLPVISSYF